MKKRAVYWLLAALLPLTAAPSCSNDEPVAVDEQAESIEIPDPVSLSSDGATEIARQAVMQMKYGDDAASRASGSLTPSEVRRYPSASRSTGRDAWAYIVNFDEGGYAVILANAANPEVLALNDEGYFCPEEQPGNAYFMELAADYSFTMKDSTEIEPYIPGGGGGAIPKDSVGNDLAYIMHDGHRCGRRTTVTIDIEKFKLIKTEWHQGKPYNNFCPEKPDDNGYMRNSCTGCVPLAMAQIMAYHGKPAELDGRIFNWSEITAYSTLPYYGQNSDNVAYLIWRIGDLSNTDYGVYSSSTSPSKIVPTLSYIGYKNAKTSSYNESVIISQITNSLPILIGGHDVSNTLNSHRWIIDGGYKLTTTKENINLDTNKICYSQSSSELYFHCNWGWEWNAQDYDKENDGFYLSGVFSPKEYDFSVIHNIIYDIY